MRSPGWTVTARKALIIPHVKDKHEQQHIIKTLTAIEGCVTLSSIALGIIQMLCLMYDGKIRVSDFRYLRTPSHQVMSGANMMEYLRRNLFRFMTQQSGSAITKIISSKQVSLEKEDIDRLIKLRKLLTVQFYK